MPDDKTDPALLQTVESLVDHLLTIQHILRRATDADIERSGLTGPQISVLEVLASTDGLSIKELSQRVRLAHSTVSGIVDRLERQGLVQRLPDENDRRFSRISVVDRVKGYTQHAEALHRPPVLVGALATLSPEDRARILESVSTLRTVLEARALE